MNAVIIGYGNRAKKVWEPALKGMHINLVAIVDPSPISDFKFKIYKSVEQISDLVGEIDFTILSTPREAHLKVSKILIDYGINHIINSKDLFFTLIDSIQVLKLSLNKNNIKKD